MTNPAASPAPGLTPDRFRAVLGRFATGISVMTSVAEGRPHAMTANAVTSVSLDPPLVLVCVDRSAVMAAVVEESGGFALTFLGEQQEAISQWFADASRPTGHDQFAHIGTLEAITGSPVLEDHHGWIDCRVWALHDGGDHVIVVGEVVALGEPSHSDIREGRGPLLYYQGGYGRLMGPAAGTGG